MTGTEDVTETDGGTEMIGAALTLDGTWTADVTWTLGGTWTADAADKRWVKPLLLRPKMIRGLKPRTSPSKEANLQQNKIRFDLNYRKFMR